MAEECTAKEMHAILVKYLEGRRDVGVWKGLLDFVLEPQNPFEPEERREPRKGFVLVMVLAGLPLGGFVYFNFWVWGFGMAAEGVALTEVSQREMPVLKVAETDGQDWAFLLVTLALVGYGCYVARDAWGKLLHIITEPGPPEFVVVALAVQVVAPFLPPLAFLAVWLSSRCETSWFPSAAVPCVLGLLTAVIEVCAHGIG
jgi:hypothetical protein